METAKNRRSSILKPQKPRDPLSDLDLVEPVKVDSPVETTKRCSLRRVSFASSNFVKKFATDPDKNTTVWDTTYEEKLNKSDNTPSLEITYNPWDTHSKKQSVVGTQHITLDGEAVTISESVNQCFITRCETAEKNCVKEHDVCAKSNRKVSINFYEQGGEDIISDSSLRDMDIYENKIIETRNIQSSNDIKNVNVIKTPRQTDNMVITQQIIQKEQCHTGTVDVGKYLPQVMNMTLADKENIPTQSQSCITNPVFSHRKFCKPINNMEDQCGASLSNIETIVKKEERNILKNKGFSTFNKSSSTIKIDTVVGNGNIKSIHQCFGSNETTMDFTQMMQSLNKSEHVIKNRTVVADENMEITLQLPVLDKNNYNSTNKTIMMDESMEYTQSLSAFNFPTLVKNEENRTIVTVENMSITQQFPDVNKSSYNPPNKTIMMDESIECTQPLPACNFPVFNADRNNESFVKNEEKRTIVAVENMSITQQFPDVDKSRYNPPNKTIIMDESLECAQPLTASNFPVLNADRNNELLVKNEENKTIVVVENMSITQQFPDVDKSSYNPPNKTIMTNESIECTRPIPTFSSLAFNVKGINENKVSLNKLTKTNAGDTQINIEDVKTKKAPKEILSISKQNINCSGLRTPGSSFHMTFAPFSPGIDDTQHLINYSLTHKQPKSDFSKIIAGDLTPSFLSSKFMPLGEFSSDAFPVSLETSRSNQTHSEHMELDKIKDWDVFPKSVPTDHNNGSRFQHEELSTTDKNSDLPVSAVTIHTTEDKNSNSLPGSLEFADNSQTHIEHMKLSNEKDYEKHNKDKPPLLVMDDSDETNMQVSNLKRRSLKNIETVVICKKPMLDNTKENDAGTINIDENMETTIAANMPTNISQEDITFFDSVVSVNNTITQEAKELITNITQSISANASMDMSTYQLSTESKRLRARYKGRILMKQKFEDFLEKMRDSLTIITRNSINLDELYEEELKEIARPLQQHSFEDIQSNTVSSDECSLVEPISDNTVTEPRLHFSDLNINVEKILTFKEKIEEKHKKCKRYWNILSIEDDKCEIDTFYKTVRLTVQFSKETGIVNNLDICYKISAESEPMALFTHKICKDRLSKKTIQSAVGEHYDILTLLDYVYMNMKKMLEIMNELDSFAKRHNLKMDYNFRVTIKIVILQLRSTWSISVDMSDIENINEDSVTAYAKIGTVNEAKIKGLVAGCPSGILFLKSFINSVLGYIDLLKSRKLKEK